MADGSTCWLSLSDRMKAWLRVSRWACDCCRCARASSKVIPAGSIPSCSPQTSPPFFLLFSHSWRRALVARFITSNLTWMLSWIRNRMDRRFRDEEKHDKKSKLRGGIEVKLSQESKRGAQIININLKLNILKITQSYRGQNNIRHLNGTSIWGVCVRQRSLLPTQCDWYYSAKKMGPAGRFTVLHESTHARTSSTQIHGKRDTWIHLALHLYLAAFPRYFHSGCSSFPLIKNDHADRVTS